MLTAWTYLCDLDMSSLYDPSLSVYFGSMGLLRPTAPDVATPTWKAWLNKNTQP